MRPAICMSLRFCDLQWLKLEKTQCKKVVLGALSTCAGLTASVTAASAGKDLRSQGKTFEVNLKINVLGFKREKQDMLCQNLQLCLCVPDRRAHRKSEGNTLFVFSFEHWKWLNLN